MTLGFTMKYVPETKGMSMEQLEKIWGQKYGAISVKR
jgi:hypothetical protein